MKLSEQRPSEARRRHNEAVERLPASRAMVLDTKRFICSSLLVQAFLFVGHPIATSQARSAAPHDFEGAPVSRW